VAAQFGSFFAVLRHLCRNGTVIDHHQIFGLFLPLGAVAMVVSKSRYDLRLVWVFMLDSPGCNLVGIGCCWALLSLSLPSEE
jgi:hypothetical protein